MDYDIPFTVVVGEVPDSPPVFIEKAISEFEKFSENVHPAMKQTVEECKQADNATNCGEDDRIKELSETSWDICSMFENRNAKCLENTPHVENEGQELSHVFYQEFPSDSPIPYVFISVNQSRSKEEIDESFGLSQEI